MVSMKGAEQALPLPGKLGGTASGKQDCRPNFHRRREASEAGAGTKPPREMCNQSSRKSLPMQGVSQRDGYFRR